MPPAVPSAPLPRLVAWVPERIEDLEQDVDVRYLSHRERELIADLLRAEKSIRAIAREL